MCKTTLLSDYSDLILYSIACTCTFCVHVAVPVQRKVNLT